MATEIVYEGMETHGLATKFIRVFSVPLMNNISPAFLKKMMRTTSHDAKTVVQNVGSNAALDAMYSRHHRSLFSRGLLQGFADLFWHHCFSQPKALRNRLALVEKNIEDEILRIVGNDLTREIRIMSVGGGSMRALTQAINRISRGKDLKMRILNIDRDLRAIEAGRELAGKLGMKDKFEWINDDARNLHSLVSKNSFDIVEMVGLLDYFSDEKGKELIRNIYDSLKLGGVFIVANVHPNEEMPFVTNLGWPFMYYRKPDDLKRLLTSSGFTNEPILILEPLKVHVVAKVIK